MEEGNFSNDKGIELLEIRTSALIKYLEFIKSVGHSSKLSYVEPLPMLVELDELDLAADFLDRRISYLQSQTKIESSEEKKELLNSVIATSRTIQEILNTSDSKEMVALQLQDLDIQ